MIETHLPSLHVTECKKDFLIWMKTGRKSHTLISHSVSFLKGFSSNVSALFIFLSNVSTYHGIQKQITSSLTDFFNWMIIDLSYSIDLPLGSYLNLHYHFWTLHQEERKKSVIRRKPQQSCWGQQKWLEKLELNCSESVPQQERGLITVHMYAVSNGR